MAKVRGEGGLEAIKERCCGLDVHKKTVVACVITPEVRRTKTFSTITAALRQLVTWLREERVEHVAMESTGVYWRPIFNMLEITDMEVMVVNAAHIKAVPGRKTDVKDAEWIAELLRHGLLRPSFVPTREWRELRDATRYRRTLIEQRAHEVQRVQKVLEGANIKLSNVATDVLGKSGRDMLEALIAGEVDAEAMAGLARGKMKAKRDALEEALEGSVGSHQRLMLRYHLDLIDFLDDRIAGMDAEIFKRMQPYSALLAVLDEIPGIGQQTAQEIVAEIGVDMSRWPSARHIASWAKLSPGNNESGGRKRRGHTGKGGPIRHIMIQAALNVSKRPNTYYGALYRRLSPSKGSKGGGNAERALVAVAHALLVAIYHMLHDGTKHHDLGPDHFEERDRDRAARRAVRKLQRFGYDITIEELEARRSVA